MSAKLDILASDISVVGESDFVANSGALDVQVNNVGATGLEFRNPAGGTHFELGDHILIQKVWGVVNWGFGAGGPTPDVLNLLGHRIGLAYWDGAVFSSLDPFPSVVASLYLPTLCHPVEFGDGLFSRMPTTGPRRQIRLSDIDLRISQVNLPGALDGERIVVQYFMQVLHNLEMAFAP